MTDGAVLPNGLTSMGEIWICSGSATDGVDTSEPTNVQVTIATVSGGYAEIFPQSPVQPQEPFVCMITEEPVFSGGATGSLSYTYTWEKKALGDSEFEVVPGLVSSLVTPDHTSDGDMWRCVVHVTGPVTTYGSKTSEAIAVNSS